LKKPKKEYKKYQSKTLSRAEKDYLDVINELGNIAKQ
jgi:hypothetical protein